MNLGLETTSHAPFKSFRDHAIPNSDACDGGSIVTAAAPQATVRRCESTTRITMTTTTGMNAKTVPTDTT